MLVEEDVVLGSHNAWWIRSSPVRLPVHRHRHAAVHPDREIVRIALELHLVAGGEAVGLVGQDSGTAASTPATTGATRRCRRPGCRFAPARSRQTAPGRW